MRKLTPVLALALTVGLTAATPSMAEPIVVFTESFENCTDPAGPPYYTEYETATQADEPIKVNLWIDEMIDCPGWTAAGQAWMTTYSSGGIFPDGSHAAWLNEGPTNGSIEREITGLTAGRDYSINLETWTDDQDQATSLILEVTNGSDVTTLTYRLRAGQGIQALSKNFSAEGDTVTIKLIGSPDTFASPLVDNIRIVDAGDTAENAANAANSGSNSSGSSNALASTGFDAVTLGGIAAVLMAGGAVLMFLRRRASRR